MSDQENKPTETTHRFALCLSGGVALGTYIAGVLTQLYRDLAAMNKELGENRFKLDVIAGSSAGSVTGLIMARAIAVGATPKQFEQAISACWVDGLSVEKMLTPPDDLSNGPITSECPDK